MFFLVAEFFWLIGFNTFFTKISMSTVVLEVIELYFTSKFKFVLWNFLFSSSKTNNSCHGWVYINFAAYIGLTPEIRPELRCTSMNHSTAFREYGFVIEQLYCCKVVDASRNRQGEGSSDLVEIPRTREFLISNILIREGDNEFLPL